MNWRRKRIYKQGYWIEELIQLGKEIQEMDKEPREMGLSEIRFLPLLWQHRYIDHPYTGSGRGIRITIRMLE